MNELDFFAAGINYKKTEASIRGQFAINGEQYKELIIEAKQAGLFRCAPHTFEKGLIVIVHIRDAGRDYKVLPYKNIEKIEQRPLYHHNQISQEHRIKSHFKKLLNR
jgi:hypothetical protein